MSRVLPDFDELAGALNRDRRPDIAAGMLIAGELLDELPDIPPAYVDVLAIAISDAATAIYDQADDVLAELITDPDGTYTQRARP